MSIISYSQFHRLAQDRAYEIHIDRVNKSAPGDHLSDWLRAERELYCWHRLSITLGICRCSTGDYERAFQGKEFVLRGIPCAFNTVRIGEIKPADDRIRNGCQAFLDEHRSLYADLMQTQSIAGGRIITTGYYPIATRTRRVGKGPRDVVLPWFTDALAKMVSYFSEDDFQKWLRIEPHPSI